MKAVLSQSERTRLVARLKMVRDMSEDVEVLNVLDEVIDDLEGAAGTQSPVTGGNPRPLPDSPTEQSE